MTSRKHPNLRSWFRFSLRTAFIVSIISGLLIGIYRTQLRNLVTGKAAVDPREQTNNQRLRMMHGRYNLSRGEQLARQLSEDSLDAKVLAGCLALLANNNSGPEPLADELLPIVGVLARHDWDTDNEESTQEMVQRLVSEIDKKKIEGEEYFLCAEQYKQHMGKQWPLEWRANRQLWLDMAEAIIQSKSARDPAGLWRRRVKFDQSHADLYRICYIALTIEEIIPRQQFDLSLVQPILDKHGESSPEGLYWQARILQAVVANRISKDLEQRIHLRKRLLSNLARSKLARGDLFQTNSLRLALANLYRIADEESEATPLLTALLEHQDRDVFDYVARAAELAAAERHAWYFKKTVSVDFRKKQFSDALQSVNRHVHVPIWIDQRCHENKKQITLKAKGSWREVVDVLMRETPYRFLQVDPTLYWIGDPQSLSSAQQLVEASRAKIPTDGGRVSAALRKSAQPWFRFEQVPLQDVRDYLLDAFHVPIFLLSTRPNTPISLEMSDALLHITLTILAKQVNCDWYVSDNAILIGSAASLDEFRQRDALRAERIERLKAFQTNVPIALGDTTEMEFIETPLHDVRDYLEDRHGIDISLVSAELKDHTVTCSIPQFFSSRFSRVPEVSLAWALDLVLYQLDLEWDSDGEVLYIGNAQDLKIFRARTDTRVQRRMNYPPDMAQKLQIPVDLEYIDTSLNDVIKYLQIQTGMPFTFASDDEELRQLRISESLYLPLDAILDLIALKNGFHWRLQNGSVKLSRE